MAADKKTKSGSKKETKAPEKKSNTKLLVIIIILLIVMLAGVVGYFLIFKPKTEAAASAQTTTEAPKVVKKVKTTSAPKTVNIESKVYKITDGNHKLKLALTLEFEDEDSALIFDGNTTGKAASEEGGSKVTETYGTSVTKDLIINMTNTEKAKDIGNPEFIKKNLLESINKFYKDKFGAEILKNINITEYYFQ